MSLQQNCPTDFLRLAYSGTVMFRVTIGVSTVTQKTGITGKHFCQLYAKSILVKNQHESTRQENSRQEKKSTEKTNYRKT